MEQKYRLELIGITFNQIESGVYALILQQVGTNRRIPIIIGFPEAQAIECKLQEVKPPRPLTHDIMMSALGEFGIRLESVLIKRLPNGVFAADLYLSDGANQRIVDARSSDAIALAIRCNAPIYTTIDVIKEASFEPSATRKGPAQRVESAPETTSSDDGDLSMKSLEELNMAMQKAATEEDYEEAARIKAEIDKRNAEG